MRLGLDMGTNSIGWWLYETHGEENEARITGVLDGGVRIFSDGRDPKTGASLAVDRRTARAIRRRRDRYLRRRATLMKVLADVGLMPADPTKAKKLEQLDPYELRTRGLDEALPLTHLGRALFHLNQRRGFKSNRKTDRGENESGKIRDATQRLDWEMREVGARTYGEFLYMRRKDMPQKPAENARLNSDGSRLDYRKQKTVRTRLSVATRGGPDANKEAGYDFYPDRRHLEEEFYCLWEAQAAHRPEVLNENLKALVFEKIFYQRPLKEPEVGLCLFSNQAPVPKNERRLPKSHPLAQRRGLFETVNQLLITTDGRKTRPLNKEQRDTVIMALDNKAPAKSLASMTLKLSALAKVLKLQEDERLTLDTGARDSITCDPVRASLSHPDRFGPRWSTLNWEAQWEVIRSIREVQNGNDFRALKKWLRENHQLDEDHAQAVANAPLPDGFSRLGLTATRLVLEHLKADVVTYARAVRLCGWHHSDQRTGECLDRLPYYGEVLERHVIPGTYNPDDDDITRFGRITNPTVHIGLNQLRRLVNQIIAVFGKPDQIVVKIARELKQSEEQKRKTIKRIRETTADGQTRSAQLDKLGIADIGHNRMLLRLWEDLGPAIGSRCCPYTGKTISVDMVFDGSCDVNHILPYSRTLDDSFANRTLCLREANMQKTNQTPWEAWGNSKQWETIKANLKHLPDNKRWRFGTDAMARFEEGHGFLGRELVDTHYLARITQSYLNNLFTEYGRVWVVPGRLTEMLRRHWGLNSLLSDADKGPANARNRTDHRHHAIDAAIVAATDHGLLNRISKTAGKREEAGQSAEMIARDTSPPWKGFRDAVERRLSTMIVSHRADHGRIDIAICRSDRSSTTGRLHNDTAYGIVDESTVVSRVPLQSLKPADIALTSRGKNIRDLQLQSALALATKGKEGKEIEAALSNFSAKQGPYQGIRRVRLIETLNESARIEVGEGKNGSPLKAYKGDSNYCYEIWRLPDGKVKPQVVTTFEANTSTEKRPHPAAKRLLRIFKRDMVAVGRNGETEVFYVQKLDPVNGLFLAPHNEANADARNRNKEDPFRLLQLGAGPIVKAGLRRVHVDELGRIRDPGPRE